HRAGSGNRCRDRAAQLRDEAGGVTRWLLVRGRGERPLGRTVDPGAIVAHSSSKRPSLEPGDLSILYASVWQAIFGVVEVVGEPEDDPGRARSAGGVAR